ncbi:MAG: CPBP family glutamic-type intramembrane protease [Acidimicrobiales bacterium]
MQEASVADPGVPRRRWWSPAPPPALPPISTRRAYTEVLLVFAAFFLVGVVGAVQLLSGEYRDPLAHASWGLYGPQVIDIAAQVGLALAVVLLLCARRGVSAATLGLSLPRRPDGGFAAGPTTRILAWAVFAQVLGGVINGLLQTGHLPTLKPTAPELLFAVADSVQAGIIEEIVVLAFVVVTLRQARRPLWEITVVALVLRGSYHIYYGPGAVGILVWAALFYWIYLRTRSLVPLIVCHAAWDAVGFLSQRWTAVAGVAVLVAIAIWIAAPITWLTQRNGGGPVPPPRWAPPGWHPDPSGLHRWRWWDGQRWTEHVSGP